MEFLRLIQGFTAIFGFIMIAYSMFSDFVETPTLICGTVFVVTALISTTLTKDGAVWNNE
jgi:hypothetical protein